MGKKLIDRKKIYYRHYVLGNLCDMTGSSMRRFFWHHKWKPLKMGKFIFVSFALKEEFISRVMRIKKKSRY